jgi:transketolase
LEGDDLLVLSYGPVLLHEVLAAAEALAKSGLRVRVVNMPWLNRFDGQWLSDLVRPFQAVVAVDDHSPVGGMGDALLRAMASEGILANRRVSLIGCEEVPVCGAPREVLEFHRLDAASLAARFADLAGSVGIQVDTSATRVESTVEADAPIG